MGPKEYYSRRDIIKEFVRISKDREVQAWFGDIPGKRPDVINFEGDVLDYVNNGMTSLHISVERWNDPLRLKSGMIKRDLDNLRKGWDFIIDIDSKVLDYSKVAAFYVIDLLKFYNINGVSLKFSGSTGFHIGVCFESFPKEVNNVNIKDLFPDGLHMVVSYIKHMIKDHMIKDLLALNSIEMIASRINKPREKLFVNGVFDPFIVVEIDTILISSRHLFRSSYSLNEKRGLISVPIKLDELKRFDIESAKPENVKIRLRFLDADGCVKGEARSLLMDAFDLQMRKEEKKEVRYAVYDIPKTAVKIDLFPPCFKLLLNGIKVDGRKRGLFMLINFLRNSGYSFDVIGNMLAEWNKKNYEPLRDGYVKAQLSWSKKQNKLILPPNCDNNNYYKGINICKPDNVCKSIKNPVNYAKGKSRVERKAETKR